MSLNTVTKLDHSLPAAVKELQGLKVSVVTGAAADTNIALAGVALEDTIISAFEFTGGVPAVITATVFSAGNIRSSTDTTGNAVMVFWFDKK